MKYGIWNAPPEPIGTEYSTAGFVNRLQGCGAVLYRRRMIDDEWFHPEVRGLSVEFYGPFSLCTLPLLRRSV